MAESACPDSVKRLVERFHRNLDAYKSGRYNETQVRVEFIDPLFIALGWDVHNKEGLPEAYKEVIHEATLKVGDKTNAPDYCFRIGSARVDTPIVSRNDNRGLIRYHLSPGTHVEIQALQGGNLADYGDDTFI